MSVYIAHIAVYHLWYTATVDDFIEQIQKKQTLINVLAPPLTWPVPRAFRWRGLELNISSVLTQKMCEEKQQQQPVIAIVVHFLPGIKSSWNEN